MIKMTILKSIDSLTHSIYTAPPKVIYKLCMINFARLKVLYLVHDLSDSAVAKRVRMLIDGGADVKVMGFRRTPTPPANIHDAKVTDLGRTYNGAFIQRTLSVIKHILFHKKLKNDFDWADCIIARNLEMLALGSRGQSAAKKSTPMVYECLDIHRLMLRNDHIGKTLRRLERGLINRCSMLIVSSPAYISSYFKKISPVSIQPELIENKVYIHTCPLPDIPPTKDPNAPWIIGWFGIVRCRKSLDILETITNKFDGKVKVLIRGKPAYDQFTDFDTQVARCPHISFGGPYRAPDDLPEIYQSVHFTWAIDMFEEGLNSDWLLPNRLYEGGLYASVPLALENVETGRKMTSLGIGKTLSQPLLDSCVDFFETLTPDLYQQMQKKSQQISSSDWVFTKDDATTIVERLYQLKPKILNHETQPHDQ